MSKSVHSDYEIPDVLDFSHLDPVGFGLALLDRAQSQQSPSGLRSVVLAPDFASSFESDEQVNEALRLVKKLRDLSAAKKSA